MLKREPLASGPGTSSKKVKEKQERTRLYTRDSFLRTYWVRLSERVTVFRDVRRDKGRTGGNQHRNPIGLGGWASSQ